MSDPISRKETLKHIERIRQAALMLDDTHRAGIIMTGMHLCEEAVRNQPSAQPEQKTGRWIKHKDGYYRCSECGSRGSAIKAHYCHHCGARMEGEEDE